jgi:tRNA U54 and U55 pseudouridine synthase Pus10
MKKPLEFVDRFGITEVSIIQKDYYGTIPYNVHFDYQKNDYEPIYIRQEKKSYIKCEIPQDKFEELADITEEWFELMQDLECAKLLMEARFINRLKRGK